MPFIARANHKKRAHSSMPFNQKVVSLQLKNQKILVLTGRLERPQANAHYPLKVACLPIPPCEQVVREGVISPGFEPGTHTLKVYCSTS